MMTSSPAAARHTMLAGERRRDSANEGHQRVERNAANSPKAQMTTDGNRWQRRRGRGGGDLRDDGDGDDPVVFGGNGGWDGDGDDLAIPTAAACTRLGRGWRLEVEDGPDRWAPPHGLDVDSTHTAVTPDFPSLLYLHDIPQSLAPLANIVITTAADELMRAIVPSLADENGVSMIRPARE
uniref:DUF834 domain-containing protein n=1 Tax=Oryza sativa subsp. japonica TaxID=39947 RepID=Q75M80_ORYSJ|nr:hypothetical protein [Oryza sativa Japonica Group]